MGEYEARTGHLPHVPRSKNRSRLTLHTNRPSCLSGQLNRLLFLILFTGDDHRLRHWVGCENGALEEERLIQLGFAGLRIQKCLLYSDTNSTLFIPRRRLPLHPHPSGRQLKRTRRRGRRPLTNQYWHSFRREKTHWMRRCAGKRESNGSRWRCVIAVHSNTNKPNYSTESELLPNRRLKDRTLRIWAY